MENYTAFAACENMEAYYILKNYVLLQHEKNTVSFCIMQIPVPLNVFYIICPT